MDALNPEQLSALLDLLVEAGVEEFEGGGIHVRFTTALFTPDKEVPRSMEQVEIPVPTRERPNSLWEVPDLWPGGEPPMFPGEKKK